MPSYVKSADGAWSLLMLIRDSPYVQPPFVKRSAKAGILNSRDWATAIAGSVWQNVTHSFADQLEVDPLDRGTEADTCS